MIDLRAQVRCDARQAREHEVGAQVAPIVPDGAVGCAPHSSRPISSQLWFSLHRAYPSWPQVQKGLEASRSSTHALQLAAKRKLTARSIARLELDLETLHTHTVELRERMRGIMADYTTEDEKFHLGIPLLQCAAPTAVLCACQTFDSKQRIHCM